MIIFHFDRVCYVFGGKLNFPITEITQTTLTTSVLSQCRQVDHIANEVLREHGKMYCQPFPPGGRYLGAIFSLSPYIRVCFCTKVHIEVIYFLAISWVICL